MRLLILLLLSFLTFAQNEIFITVEPFRDWKPKLELQSKTPYGDLKFEYKLFGEKKLKYKLFNLFDVNLSKETFKHPEKIKGLQEYRKTVELLIKKQDNLGDENKIQHRLNPIFCQNFDKNSFCNFTEKENLLVFPLNVLLKNFTIFVEYKIKPKRCEILSAKTFTGLEIISISLNGPNLKVNFGGLLKFLKISKKDYLIISKLGRKIYIETSKDKAFLLTELKSVYISKILIYKQCLRIYKFYFYPRSLTMDELKILKEELFGTFTE